MFYSSVGLVYDEQLCKQCHRESSNGIVLYIAVYDCIKALVDHHGEVMAATLEIKFSVRLDLGNATCHFNGRKLDTECNVSVKRSMPILKRPVYVSSQVRIFLDDTLNLFIC